MTPRNLNGMSIARDTNQTRMPVIPQVKGTVATRATFIPYSPGIPARVLSATARQANRT
jgi:hypothetical protein